MQRLLFELPAPRKRVRAGDYLLACRGYWRQTRVRPSEGEFRLSQTDCACNCVFCPSAGPRGWHTGVEKRLVFQVRKNFGDSTPVQEKLEKRTTEIVGNGTDPYQRPAQSFLTHRVLRELSQGRGLSLTVVTRSALAARDIPRFRRFALRNDLELVIPLMSLDEKLLSVFEPGASTPSQRLHLLAELADAGLSVVLSVGPVVPGLTDSLEDMESLVLAARKSGAARTTLCCPDLDESSREDFFSAVRAFGRHREELCRNLYGSGSRPPDSYVRVVATRLRALGAKHGFEADPGRGTGWAASRLEGQQLRFL